MSDQPTNKSVLTDKDENRLYKARHLALFISNLAFSSLTKDQSHITVNAEAFGETMLILADLTDLNAGEV